MVSACTLTVLCCSICEIFSNPVAWLLAVANSFSAVLSNNSVISSMENDSPHNEHVVIFCFLFFCNFASRNFEVVFHCRILEVCPSGCITVVFQRDTV